MKRLLVMLGWCGALMADEAQHLSGAGRDPDLDRAGFQSIAVWGKEFSEWTRKPTRFLPRDWKTRIQLAFPPANSSNRTRKELEVLAGRIGDRTRRQGQIEKEIEITNFRFGDHLYGDLINDANYAETAKLLQMAYLDVAVAIFHFKRRFDRIRPSVLAGRLGVDLDASIEIPGHPAYPSGHATGAYAFAYLFQELDPGGGARYLADARRIGENREVAGVHYPSDTEAGRRLARQLVDLMLEHSGFARQLEKARGEW